MGAPHPLIDPCPPSTLPYYTVTSQQDVPGAAQVGDYSVSGASGSKSF